MRLSPERWADAQLEAPEAASRSARVGVMASFRSIVRLRDNGTAVRNNAGHGAQLFSGSVVDFRNPSSGASPVSVTGNTAFGLKCFAATNYAGNVTGVTGNTGGGNVDTATNDITGCSRF